MMDLLREGLDGLWAHRVRSFLSALGILFGVAAVIGILAIGEGAKRETELLIERLGIQNFQVNAVEPEGDEDRLAEMARRSRGLTTRDLQALREALPEAERVGGARTLQVSGTVPRARSGTLPAVLGADTDYLAALNLILLEGRPFSIRDEEARSRVALLGPAARRDLFGPHEAVGQKLRLDQTWYTVVGVFQERGLASGARLEGFQPEQRDNQVVIPLSTAMAHAPPDPATPELSEIVVMVLTKEAVAGQADVARRVLERLHNDQPDFEILVPLELLEQSRAQQRIFNLVMGLIAGISLLVGGIGIMNIMLASVLERTREIGVRMAVGATPRDVLLLFLTESALISLVGGLLGILAGHVLAFAVAAFTGWATAVSLGAVGLAALISMVEGVLFGLLPARRAAALPPALAVKR